MSDVRDHQQHFVKGLSTDIAERSMLLSPIILGDEAIGVISADFHGLDGFDTQDQVLLEALTRHIYSALHNKYLYENEKRENALIEVGKKLSSFISLNENDLYELICKQAIDKLNMINLSIAIYNENEEQAKFILAYEDGAYVDIDNTPFWKPRHYSSPDSKTIKVIRERKTIYEKSQRKKSGGSWLGVPMVIGNSVLGVIATYHKQDNFYRYPDIKILEAFASQSAIILKNTRLLKDISEAVNISRNISDFYSKLYDILVKLINAKNFYIALYDGKDKYEIDYFRDNRRNELFPYKIFKEGLGGYVFNKKQPLIITPESDQLVEQKINESPVIPIGYWLGVPLNSYTRAIGVLAIYSYTYELVKYGNEELDSLKFISEHIAMAIERINMQDTHVRMLENGIDRRSRELQKINCQLKKTNYELKQGKNQIEAAYNISKLAYLGKNLDEVYKHIHGIIKSLMYADNFRILIYGNLVYYRDEYDTDLGTQDSVVKKGLTNYVLKTGKPLYPGPKTYLNLINRGEIEDVGTRSMSWLGVPLKINGNIIGVIVVQDYHQESRYGKSEQDILTFISEQIAMAIERVRAEEELRKQQDQLQEHSKKLETLNRRQKILIDLAQKITTSIKADNEIFDLIHRNASELMDTHNMYIALYDEKKNEISFPLSFKNGNPIEQLYQPRQFNREDQGRTEWIIDNKKHILIKTRKESEEWYYEDVETKKLRKGRKEFMDDPLASWIGVPMMVGERVIGVVATYHPTKDYVYSEDDVEILQAMANIAAIALDNARLYSKEERYAKELEKQVEHASRKIAETQDIITRSIVAADIVHRLNNLVGTIPIWTTSIKDKIEEMAIAIQNDMKNMIEQSVTGISKSQGTDYIYRLRNIVGTIPIWTDLLRKETEKGSGAILDDVNKLLREVERLKSPPEKEEVDINLILQTIFNRFRIQYRKEIKTDQLKIKKDIVTDLYKIWGIYSSVYDGIFNVVSNGIESILEKSGTLTVTASNYTDNQSSDWVKIEIKDTGKGIPDNIKEKIFTPFFTTKGTGRGYGLWRSKAIIENFGGRIEVKSQYGQGATFTILLPKIKTEEA